jgi:hypothetical protein
MLQAMTIRMDSLHSKLKLQRADPLARLSIYVIKGLVRKINAPASSPAVIFMLKVSARAPPAPANFAHASPERSSINNLQERRRGFQRRRQHRGDVYAIDSRCGVGRRRGVNSRAFRVD